MVMKFTMVTNDTTEAGKSSKASGSGRPFGRGMENCMETFPAEFVNLKASCVLYIGQAFRYSPGNAFYIFNQHIYFIIGYLLDRASLI